MSTVKAISWAGVRTERFAEMRTFVRRLTGVQPWVDEPGFAVFDLVGGDRFEVFDAAAKPHFTTGPVVGFLVEDVDRARADLEADGVEFIGPTGRAAGNAWAHFRGPDGNVYEITSHPDHPEWRRLRGGDDPA